MCNNNFIFFEKPQELEQLPEKDAYFVFDNVLMIAQNCVGVRICDFKKIVLLANGESNFLETEAFVNSREVFDDYEIRVGDLIEIV